MTKTSIRVLTGIWSQILPSKLPATSFAVKAAAVHAPYVLFGIMLRGCLATGAARLEDLPAYLRMRSTYGPDEYPSRQMGV